MMLALQTLTLMAPKHHFRGSIKSGDPSQFQTYMAAGPSAARTCAAAAAGSGGGSGSGGSGSGSGSGGSGSGGSGSGGSGGGGGEDIPDDVSYLQTDELRRLLKDAGVKGFSKLARDALLEQCLEHGLVTRAQADARRTNPARAALMRERRGARETVVKCYLSSLFHKTAAASRRGEVKTRLMSTVRKCVAYVSRLARRGSIVAWLHFHRLLSAGRELPPLDDVTFFRNLFTAPVTDLPEVSATWRKYRRVLARLFVPTNPVPNSYNLVTYLATTFRTNFIVNIWKPLPARLKRAFSILLKDGTIPEPRPRDVTPDRMLQCVEKGTVPAAWPDQAKRVVRMVRSALGVPLGIELTEAWLKAHLHETLRFTFKLARWIQTRAAAAAAAPKPEGGRRRLYFGRVLAFCPIFSARAHHIRIDGDVLHAIAKHAGVLPADVPSSKPTGAERAAVFDSLWKEFFPRACKLRGASFELAHLLDTDGVSASVHFRRERTDEDSARAAGPLGRGKKKQHGVTDVLGRTVTSSAAAASFTLAIDPGTHLLAQAALLDAMGKPVTDRHGKPRRWRLTRGQYRHDSGAKTIAAERAHRCRDLAPVDVALSAQRVRTTYASEFCAYVATFATHQRKVWRVMLRRKVVALRVRAWMGRRRVVDRFWRRVRTETPPDTIVAYGAATWSSTGRGALVAPRRDILAGASRHFSTVVMQGEYMTSQTCDKCEGHVKPIWRQLRWRICMAGHRDVVDDEVRLQKWHQLRLTRQAGCEEVRGLRVCSNCRKLRSRDAMAALNIGKAFRAALHGTRLPTLMDRAAAERQERRTVIRETC